MTTTQATLTAVPIREVVRRTGCTKQAVYQAIEDKRLTETTLFGNKAVKVDDLLKAFERAARQRSKAKPKPKPKK